MQRRAVTLKFTYVLEVRTACIIKAMTFILTAVSTLNLTLKLKKNLYLYFVRNESMFFRTWPIFFQSDKDREV
jgi:hypothetical protein